jgi:hypothetical protein
MGIVLFIVETKRTSRKGAKKDIQKEKQTLTPDFLCVLCAFA